MPLSRAAQQQLDDLGDFGGLGGKFVFTVSGTKPFNAFHGNKAALDAAGKPFPTELPMRREVFVAKNRAEAIRLCAPYLGAKYKAYHAWRQDMPEDDRGLDQGFESLIGDRFLIGSPDEVAEQILALHRRLGINHLVMSTEWAGMPESLAVETIEMIAKELFPRVRQGM